MRVLLSQSMACSRRAASSATPRSCCYESKVRPHVPSNIAHDAYPLNADLICLFGIFVSVLSELPCEKVEIILRKLSRYLETWMIGLIILAMKTNLNFKCQPWSCQLLKRNTAMALRPNLEHAQCQDEWSSSDAAELGTRQAYRTGWATSQSIHHQINALLLYLSSMPNDSRP